MNKENPNSASVPIADVFEKQMELLKNSPPGSLIEVLADNALRAMSLIARAANAHLSRGERDQGIALLQIAVGLGPAVVLNPATGQLEGSFVAFDANGNVVEQDVSDADEIPASLANLNKPKLH
jgi:hypothetical protein